MKDGSDAISDAIAQRLLTRFGRDLGVVPPWLRSRMGFAAAGMVIVAEVSLSGAAA